MAVQSVALVSAHAEAAPEASEASALALVLVLGASAVSAPALSPAALASVVVSGPALSEGGPAGQSGLAAAAALSGGWARAAAAVSNQRCPPDRAAVRTRRQRRSCWPGGRGS